MVAWPSLADHLGVDTSGQQNRRDRVPEVMQSDRRQPYVLGLTNRPRERLWMEWLTVLGSDDQARVGAGRPRQPLGRLLGAVSPQRVQHLRCQGEERRPLAVLGSRGRLPSTMTRVWRMAMRPLVRSTSTQRRPSTTSTHSQRCQQEPGGTADPRGPTRGRFRPARLSRCISTRRARGGLALGGHVADYQAVRHCVAKRPAERPWT